MTLVASMNRHSFLGVAVLLTLGGCATARQRETSEVAAASRPTTPPDTPRARATPLRPAPDRNKISSDPLTLDAYEVRESAFSDFGMSVKTNFEVQWGGRVAWMLVSGVVAGSSAAQQRLAPGDKIMAIDGQLITDLERDAMLALFFQRKPGERARVLVLSRGDALPRFTNLVASRPKPTP